MKQQPYQDIKRLNNHNNKKGNFNISYSLQYSEKVHCISVRNIELAGTVLEVFWNVLFSFA